MTCCLLAHLVNETRMIERENSMLKKILMASAFVLGSAAVAQAGCGIVYDSVPASEFEETMKKAQALLKAIDQAESTQPAKEVAGAAAHR